MECAICRRERQTVQVDVPGPDGGTRRICVPCLWLEVSDGAKEAYESREESTEFQVGISD